MLFRFYFSGLSNGIIRKDIYSLEVLVTSLYSYGIILVFSNRVIRKTYLVTGEWSQSTPLDPSLYVGDYGIVRSQTVGSEEQFTQLG